MLHPAVMVWCQACSPWQPSSSALEEKPEAAIDQGRRVGAEAKVTPQTEPSELAMLLKPLDAALSNARAVAAHQGDEAAALRHLLLSCATVSSSALALLESAEGHISQAGSSRSGYLLTLDELVGPKPTDRSWRDEWLALKQETALRMGFPSPTPEDTLGNGMYSCTSKVRDYQDQVQFKLERGWQREHAEAHVCLSGVTSAAIAASVKECSPRYAASVHIISEGLSHAACNMGAPAPTTYYWLHGKGAQPPAPHKPFVPTRSPLVLSLSLSLIHTHAHTHTHKIAIPVQQLKEADTRQPPAAISPHCFPCDNCPPCWQWG